MHAFVQKLLENWPPDRWAAHRCVVAVSGGADSVALLRAMVATGKRDHLLVRHLNHGLRPESDEEADFVAQMCRALGVECRTGHAALDGTSAPDGLEAAAREARYAFLQKEAEAAGARYVATAHTADDQAETVLHRIIRGTGMAGLAGIPRVRALSPGVSLVRPLLQATRRDVLAYLADLGQPYCEDASNRDPQFTRNRIRHEVLPLLTELNSGVVESLTRLAALAGEADAVIGELVDKLVEQCVERSGHDVTIDCAVLCEQPDYLTRQLLLRVWTEAGWPRQAMGYDEWQRLAQMARGEAESPWTFPGNIRAATAGAMLDLAPQPGDGS